MRERTSIEIANQILEMHKQIIPDYYGIRNQVANEIAFEREESKRLRVKLAQRDQTIAEMEKRVEELETLLETELAEIFRTSKHKVITGKEKL